MIYLDKTSKLWYEHYLVGLRNRETWKHLSSCLHLFLLKPTQCCKNFETFPLPLFYSDSWLLLFSHFPFALCLCPLSLIFILNSDYWFRYSAFITFSFCPLPLSFILCPWFLFCLLTPVFCILNSAFPPCLLRETLCYAFVLEVAFHFVLYNLSFEFSQLSNLPTFQNPSAFLDLYPKK